MKIVSSKVSFIELLGMYGKFEVLNSSYVIHYFSTYANNRESAYRELLKELKPMRERLDVSEIEDLSALLQRDLNDLRVANELIPYLENKRKDKNHIAFFPAILGVITPTNFIKTSKGKYPTTTKVYETPNSFCTSYSDFWELERFKDENGRPSSLGKMKINFGSSSVIVLDGQHRANAFRVLANCFNNDSNKLYANFYEEVKPIDSLNSDLPVTLVWFEATAQSEVEPKMISRKLFVDVNNSAKSVSKSRTILLNDRSPSSILTRFFYSRVAKNSSFDTSKFSLLHSGFDVDTDLKVASPHIFTLTTPEIIDYAFDWFFFGSRAFSDLTRYQSREIQRKYIEHFEKYLSKDRKYVEFAEDVDGVPFKRVKSEANLEEFEGDFNSICGAVFEIIFNEFNFLKVHYAASDIIEKAHDKRAGEWETPSMTEAWEKLYKGGEGLYYVFNNINKKKSSIMISAKAIAETFSFQRAALLGNKNRTEVDDAYKSFRSLAFQVGIFMALETLYNSNSKFKNLAEASANFVTRLNKWNPSEWVYILTKVRDVMIKDVDPKSWPSYHNLIIRLIQDKDEFYNNASYKNHSPEAKIFEKLFVWEATAYVRKEYRRELNQTKQSEISEELKAIFIESAYESVVSLFKPLKGFKILPFDKQSIADNQMNLKLIQEDDE